MRDEFRDVFFTRQVTNDDIGFPTFFSNSISCWCVWFVSLDENEICTCFGKSYSHSSTDTTGTTGDSEVRFSQVIAIMEMRCWSLTRLSCLWDWIMIRSMTWWGFILMNSWPIDELVMGIYSTEIQAVYSTTRIPKVRLVPVSPVRPSDTVSFRYIPLDHAYWRLFTYPPNQASMLKISIYMVLLLAEPSKQHTKWKEVGVFEMILQY